MTQSWPTDSPSAWSVIAVHRRQRGVGSFWPAEHFAEEGEILVAKRARQALGRLSERMPAEIGLPRIHRLRGCQFVYRLEEVGRGHVERIEVANLHVVEIGGEIEIGRQLLKVGDGVDVVALLGIAEFGAAGGGFGERGLDLEHGVGFLRGLLGRIAGEREHPGHVLDVLLANGGKAVEQVVVAIGQRKAGLADGGYLP